MVEKTKKYLLLITSINNNRRPTAAVTSPHLTCITVSKTLFHKIIKLNIILLRLTLTLSLSSNTTKPTHSLKTTKCDETVIFKLHEQPNQAHWRGELSFEYVQ
jgi:hypothetical protein